MSAVAREFAVGLCPPSPFYLFKLIRIPFCDQTTAADFVEVSKSLRKAQCRFLGLHAEKAPGASIALTPVTLTVEEIIIQRTPCGCRSSSMGGSKRLSACPLQICQCDEMKPHT